MTPERANGACRPANGMTARNRLNLAGVEGEGSDAVGDNGGQGIAQRGVVERAIVADVVARAVGMEEEGLFRTCLFIKDKPQSYLVVADLVAQWFIIHKRTKEVLLGSTLTEVVFPLFI